MWTGGVHVGHKQRERGGNGGKVGMKPRCKFMHRIHSEEYVVGHGGWNQLMGSLAGPGSGGAE